jgi:hypothetical protein
MGDEMVFGPARAVFVDHASAHELVVLTGKVFEIGSYPDRDFSIDELEMDAAIACFAPVANDLEHSRLREVLGNSLGELRRVWRTGKDVFGEVVVPKWLASLASNSVKVSLAFDRAKRLWRRSTAARLKTWASRARRYRLPAGCLAPPTKRSWVNAKVANEPEITLSD